MDKLRDIIPQALKILGIKQKYTIAWVVRHWAEIVGEEIAVHARPARAQNGILFIAVNNSVWSHHLSMMKNSLIDKICTVTGERIIKDIRFFAGSTKDIAFSDDEQVEKALPTVFEQAHTIKLSEQEQEKIRQNVALIKDEKTKKKIENIIKKDMALIKVKEKNNWKACIACGTLCSPPDKYCTTCIIARKEEKIFEICRLLVHVPWITYEEAGQYVACTIDEFKVAKDKLIDGVRQELYNGNIEKHRVVVYIMLTTGCSLNQIDDELIEKTRQKLRRKEYVSASRSGHHSAVAQCDIHT